MPWLLVTHVALLVAWYTVLPALPAWLVFSPLLFAGVGLAIWLVAMLAIVASK